MKYEKRIDIDGQKLKYLLREKGYVLTHLSQEMGASYDTYLSFCCSCNKINEDAIWWLEDNCGINYVDYAVEEPIKCAESKPKKVKCKVSLEKDAFDFLQALSVVSETTVTAAANRIITTFALSDLEEARSARNVLKLAKKMGGRNEDIS